MLTKKTLIQCIWLQTQLVILADTATMFAKLWPELVSHAGSPIHCSYRETWPSKSNHLCLQLLNLELKLQDEFLLSTFTKYRYFGAVHTLVQECPNPGQGTRCGPSQAPMWPTARPLPPACGQACNPEELQGNCPPPFYVNESAYELVWIVSVFIWV